MKLSRDMSSLAAQVGGRARAPRRAALAGRPPIRRAAVAGGLALVAAAALAGCGEIKNTIKPAPYTANQITVELAGPPNAYYAGLYAAQALGYFRQADLDVTFRTPGTGQDPLTMLHDGQVLAAISSEPSVFLSRNQEQPVVAIGALIRDPLSEIPIAVPPTHAPSGGKGVAGTGTGTRRTKSKGKAKKGKKAKTTTTTTTVPATTTTGTATTTTGTTTTTTGAAGTTTGTTTTGATTTPTPAQVPTGAAWPGQLQSLLAQPSAPTYNGLVVVVRKGTIVDDAGLVRRLIQTIHRGYMAVQANPRGAVADLIAADPGLASAKRTLRASVRSLLPYFFPSGTIWGWQSEKNWNAFGTWLYDNKLIDNPNAVTDASTNELLQGEGV